ncbi:MAG: ABC transporter permease [Oscillospiraceae bacterium]|nr:ABC transporter permease [Oscillospiraceae bacterium]
MLLHLAENIKEIWAYREMLKSLVKKDLRTRYKGSFLGFLWTFVSPMLQVAVYAIIFPYLLRNTVEHYTMFLFVAQVPWNFFTNSILGSCGLFIYNSDLVTKVYFPREVLPLSNALGGLCNMCFGFMVVFVLLLVSGISLTWNVLWIPVLFVLQTIFCAGIALLFSSINVYFRDIEHLMSIIVMAMYFATPIMYDLKALPLKAQKLLYLNPMTGFILNYRNAVFYGTGVDFSTLFYPMVLSFVLFITGMIVFDHLQKGFTEVL